MKKSTVRRLLVLCLCLTVITISLVGGTLAKYTTSASGSDSARVAYWGWNNAETLTFDLFDGNYTNVSGVSV